MNYFLCCIFKDYHDTQEIFGVVHTSFHARGTSGVGRTNMQPGINEYPADNPHGLVYIAPCEYVESEAMRRRLSPYVLTPEQLHEIILSYYQ